MKSVEIANNVLKSVWVVWAKRLGPGLQVGLFHVCAWLFTYVKKSSTGQPQTGGFHLASQGYNHFAQTTLTDFKTFLPISTDFISAYHPAKQINMTIYSKLWTFRIWLLIHMFHKNALLIQSRNLIPVTQLTTRLHNQLSGCTTQES